MTIDNILEGLKKRDPRAIGRAITMVENGDESAQAKAEMKGTHVRADTVAVQPDQQNVATHVDCASRPRAAPE